MVNSMERDFSTQLRLVPTPSKDNPSRSSQTPTLSLREFQAAGPKTRLRRTPLLPNRSSRLSKSTEVSPSLKRPADHTGNQAPENLIHPHREVDNKVLRLKTQPTEVNLESFAPSPAQLIISPNSTDQLVGHIDFAYVLCFN
jgi:hypothetical protein